LTYPSFPKNCKSLLCKYLTKEVYEELKDKKHPTALLFKKP